MDDKDDKDDKDLRTIKMVTDKFPNGLIGPIGLRIIRTIRRGYHFPRISPRLAPLFVVRRVPSATLGKNATDG